MKNLYQIRPILIVFFLMCLWLSLGFNSKTAHAVSENRAHELGVYSLWSYGEYNGQEWKGRIPALEIQDPAGLFWAAMTSLPTDESAHRTSRCRVNEQVTYQTVFPIAGDGWKSWDQFDLVFFYGHNNTITPPHPLQSDPEGCGSFFWSNNSGSWEKISGCWADWGTSSLPYEYYYRDQTDGPEKPGAVVYLWEPFTSALLGYQFQPEKLSYYQKTAQDSPSGNSSLTYAAFESGLGTDDLEWLILHGCQAVIVACEDGSSYNPTGVSAFSRTWDRFHIILGHYRTYERRQLGDLFVFANNLMSGMAIQSAYFLTDPDQNTAAISAESKPWYRTMGGYLENHSYMVHDTWTEPMDDIESRWEWGRRFFWYVRWIRQDGSIGDHRTIRRGSSGAGIDAAYVEIEDSALQEFVKSDMIAVRAEEYTVPSGEYPIITVEEIDEEYTRNILEKNVSLFSGTQISEDEIIDSEHIYSAHIDSQLYWVGKASGAYTFTETDKIMAVPCEIKSVEDAVEMALAYVAEMQLVDLQEDETLDVVFVSQVINAAVDDGEKEPFLSYPSDYFVSFGRRYKEIPVINSYVTVRIGGEGKLLGVQKNWRMISGESGTVAVDQSVVEELMVAHLLEYGIIEDGEGMESIEIVSMYCGYIEGYTSNKQDMMGLGCIVNYRHSGSEMISQVVFPVAEIDFPLCGTETIEPGEYEEPIDDEEEPEDESEESGTSHLLTAVLVGCGIFVVKRRGN